MTVHKTQALIAPSVGAPFELQDVYIDEQELGNDQALIDFKVAGICHTDIIAWQGALPPLPFPAALGHEGAGIVRWLPPGYTGDIAVGDTVLCSFDSCGDCHVCKDARPSACPSFFPLNMFGAFHVYSDEAKTKKISAGFFGQSSFMQLGAARIPAMCKIDKSVDLALICAFACGLQTGFGTVLNKLLPPPPRSFDHLPGFKEANLTDTSAPAYSAPSNIAVFGVGGVGMGAIIAAKEAGFKHIIAVDMVQSRLDLAKEAGATHTVDAHLSSEETIKAIKEASTHGLGVEAAIEASGIPIALSNAIMSLAPHGRVASVGAPPPTAEITINIQHILANSLTYCGVIVGDSWPKVFLPYMIHLFQQGKFKIMEKLVKTYKPSEMNEAIADAHAGTTVKPVIVWS